MTDEISNMIRFQNETVGGHPNLCQGKEYPVHNLDLMVLSPYHPTTILHFLCLQQQHKKNNTKNSPISSYRIAVPRLAFSSSEIEFN